jgi:hypothetical protein
MAIPAVMNAITTAGITIVIAAVAPITGFMTGRARTNMSAAAGATAGTATVMIMTIIDRPLQSRSTPPDKKRIR